MRGKVIEQFAAAYADGSSDKVWGACYTDAGEFVVAYGRRPIPSQGGTQECGTAEKARTVFEKKIREKLNKGYVACGFDQPQFGLRSFGVVNGEAPAVVAASASVRAKAGWQTSHVMPTSEAELGSFARQSSYGISEKANGVRCVLVGDGAGEVVAYNRRAQRMGGVPGCAARLGAFGRAFRIDGEWISGGEGETYVAFDVMEIAGEDVAGLPFAQRFAQLETALVAERAILASAPTVAEAEALSRTPGLALLSSEPGAEVFTRVSRRVKDRGGEGVIVRHLSAPYQEGDTRHVLKVKYTSSIDVVGVRVEPGTNGGSLVMGLVRPADGCVIEVGQVRSGLTATDMAKLAEMIGAGQNPVLEVDYLGARTVGLKLVEARTSFGRLRGDKSAADCTTDQLGADRQGLVAQAAAA